MKFLNILSIEEAQKVLNDHYRLTPDVETIDIRSSLARVLAEDFHARINVPSFDRSRMDGYALIAEDTFKAREGSPVTLKKIGDIAAGDSKTVHVETGSTAGIATGAPVPSGADAVVMIEYTTMLTGNLVEIERPVVPGENISPGGSDISSGGLLVKEGTLIASRHLGILASQGISKIKVYRKPRVAILSTGNEIIEPGTTPESGKVFDINSHSIMGRVQECGGYPSYLGIVGDSRVELESILNNSINEFDMIISSGGTSKGTGDLLSDVIDCLGDPGIIVHGVSMKPGKPIIIGIIKGKPIFCLPGNPVSALIAFNVFVSNILFGLSKRPGAQSKKIKASLGIRFNNPTGRYVFQLVLLRKNEKDEHIAYPVAKDSGAITAINEADGILEIPPNTAIIDKGSTVEITLI